MSRSVPEHGDYLRRLGASTLIDRSELAETIKRPLQGEHWAGCVDAVDGAMLARVLGQMKYGTLVRKSSFAFHHAGRPEPSGAADAARQ